ncbi:Bromodomain and wd repeat-containing protein 1, partial [Globisporangium splendens]
MSADDDTRDAAPLSPSAGDSVLAGSGRHHLFDPFQPAPPRDADANAAAEGTQQDAGEAGENDVDEAEVFFLIADFLKRRSKCQKAADMLIEELTEHKLLKETMDWQGVKKTATYADYRLRHRDIGSNHLLGLMKTVSSASSARAATPSKKIRLTPRGAAASKSSFGWIGSKSLLMKARVANQRLHLADDDRKALAKAFVSQLFALRKNIRTQRVVERVIHKYERLRQYIDAASVDELPEAVRNQVKMAAAVVTVGEPQQEGVTPVADHVASLAADVRALKQLMQLKQEQKHIDATMHSMLEKATRASLFQTRLRTGRNQVSLFQRREVRPPAQTPLPSPFVYSRWRRLKTLDGHLQIRAFCLTYDKTGKFVITGADDRLVKIWSLATGDLLFTLRGHVGNITDLAVNSSNTLLASSSDDKTVRVWELRTGAPVAVLLGHSNVVNSVRFHPTKNVVVTASNDGRCFCYTLPDIPCVNENESNEPETKLQTAQRLNAIKAYLLSLHPVFSLSHGAVRQGARSCKVLCLSFSRCGKYVITGGQDGIGRVWDVSIFSSSDAPVSASQYQHEGELQINDPGANPPPVIAPVVPNNAAVPTAEVPPAATPHLPMEPQVAPSFPVAPQETTTLPNADPSQPGQAPADIAQVQLPTNGADALPGAAADATVPAPTPQRQQTQLPELPQNGVPLASIVDVDVPQLPTKEPIALLQGHTGPITNIVYSNDGNLIATASIKDGTTRIWQWDKKRKKLTHKVLFEEETDANDQFASLYGVQTRKRAAPAVDTLSWTHDDKRLITLHSVKPDSHAPDADWKQRVRIWDPSTGKLLMTLAAIDKEKKNGHTNAVFVMDVHPTDWRIVVTAGYDGRIFLWDIATGRMLKSFTNMSPDSELVPMLDGGFIPNGNGFCFTDRIGRLLIFGTGSGEQYAATPVQQYFQSDYAALITDRNFNVLDRETQQIPSLMASGPLVDIYQIEYPHQPPHLVRSGAASWTVDQYKENRRLRIQQATESEIKCRVRHVDDDKDEIESFPSAIYNAPSLVVDPSTEVSGVALATSSYRLNGTPVALSELRRRYNANARRGEAARRRSSASFDERDTSILNIEISSEDDRSDEDFQAPARNRNDDDDDEEEDDEDDDDDDDDDDEMDDDDILSDHSGGGRDSPPQFRRRRRARASTSTPSNVPVFPRRGGRRLRDSPIEEEEEEDAAPRTRRSRRNSIVLNARRIVESDDEGNVDNQTEGGDHAGDGRRGSMDDSNEVVVESNDGFIMGDNQLDKFDRSATYEQLLEAKRIQLRTTRDNTVTAEGEEALIPCAFCHGGDDGGVLKLPGDSMGVHPLINGAQRLFVHDQCAIASPLCFNRGGKWYNVTKEIRRGRSLICVECKKRGATVGCTVPSCPKSYHWKCAIGCGWSMNQMHFYCPTHESLRSEEERKEAEGGDAQNDPVTKRFGRVFHREWLQRMSLANVQSYVPQVGDYVTYFPQGHLVYLRVLLLREPAFLLRFRKFFALKCRVVDVKYVFPTLKEYDTCSSIKCEISLAVLAVPSAAVQSGGTEEETKTDEADAPPASDYFHSESSPFAAFTGVDAHLNPSQEIASERFEFNFMYHAHDVANFLVLDHVYENGVRGEWQVGERIEMPIVELDPHGVETPAGSTYGTIRGFSPKFVDSERRILSPWESVEVDWEDPELVDVVVSPWEIEPVAGSTRRQEKRHADAQRRESRLHRSRRITGGKRALLLQEVDTVMNLSISRDFLYPVDNTFLDYILTVANPIDLTKIQQRVRNRYYRQVEAFIADAQLLYINCETYNVPTSSIAQNSRSIYAALLSQVLRHFPTLLRGENWDPQGDCRVFTYPPNDFVEGFDDDGDDEQEEISAVAEAPPLAAVYTTNSVDTARVSNDFGGSPARQPRVVQSPLQQPSPARRRVHRSAAATAAMLGHDEETKAEDNPEPVMVNSDGQSDNVLGTAPTRRTQPLVKITEQEPAITQSPARSQRGRTNTATSLERTPTRSAASKRKRCPSSSTAVDGVLDYEALLDNLTTPQRERFERQCDEDLSQVLRDFHEALSQLDVYAIFAEPVTEAVAPNYFSIIENPMDFGTISERIDRYQHFTEYFDDLYLTFSNAITYNTWEGVIGEVVKELQDHYVKFLLDAVGGGKPEHPPSGSSRRKVTPTLAAATAIESSTKSQKAKLKAKQNTTAGGRRGRKPAISDDDDEESWGGNSTNDESLEEEDEEEEDEDEDDEDEDDEDEDDESSDDSDYGGAKKRRASRSSSSSQKSGKRRRSA